MVVLMSENEEKTCGCGCGCGGNKKAQKEAGLPAGAKDLGLKGI